MQTTLKDKNQTRKSILMFGSFIAILMALTFPSYLTRVRAEDSMDDDMDMRPFIRPIGMAGALVDDGLATGATMRAAIQAARAQSPARIVVAVPVAPPETLEALYGEVDELVCPLVPERMVSVGYWYQDFPQTSDEEVMTLMGQADQQALYRSAPHD